ncbi:cold-inducible protein YdjO-related protein [Alicyclobacillus ferrooxydans]|uniref:Cold-shock protein n=1 Tax=Alicyclobacillus ferrooxydans TaxID=471514 RepID=A0A0P9EGX6_9BACL|nr:cold-inducible protein YdjO-related protein [Alicyclobacillus ferrooxydans]KPV41787.1 hypothetical protein AN477_20320 [Alicyclobacillus ferrooxydans]
MSPFGSRRKPAVEPVYANTMIWQCTECNCWSRDEFIHEEKPHCPMCHAEMNRETKNIRIE